MTELGTTWQREDLGGGHFQHTQWLRPVNYDIGGGVMRAIVSDWADGDAAFPHAVSAAKFQCYTAAGGERRMCPTGELDRWVSVGAPYIKPAGTWQQVNLGTATRSGNTLSWSTPQANVYALHGGHFVKLGVLLKGGWLPPNNQFAFPVTLNGLTYNGGHIYRDGVEVCHVRPPYVEDLDNPDAEPRPVAWDYVHVGGQWYILFTLPSLAGMTQPLIDPTFDHTPDDTEGLDTYMREASADSNFQGIQGMLCSIKAGTNRRYGLLKFDVSSIPADATVDSASTDLYNYVQIAADVHYTLNNVLAANSAWTEAGATWNYAVATTTRWAGDAGANGGTDAGCSISGTDFSATALGTFTVVNNDAVGTKYTVTLTTAQVQAWLAGNQGFRLASDYANDGPGICSSENGTAGYRPRIVIGYTEAAAGQPTMRRWGGIPGMIYTGRSSW